MIFKEDTMIKKLLKLIFKKELDEITKELNYKYDCKLKKMDFIVRQNEMRYGLIKQVFQWLPNAEIIGLEENKTHQELIIVLCNETIYLFGEDYQVFDRVPRIYFEIYDKPQKHIHIIDVLTEDDNIGNGSVAMKALIKHAKKIDAKWIGGTLSNVDDDHADRRNHFYEKFGFNIDDSSIKLEL